MRNKKKSLAIVITLGILASFCLAASLAILLGVNAISLSILVVAALTSGYLMLLFKRRNDLRPGSRRIQIPFILFGILVIPVIVTLSILLIYSYEFHLVLVSLMMPLTFINVMFYLPIAVYEKFFNNPVHNRVLASLPVISIIVPAYNEAANIRHTLDSIIESDYPAKEIIVVDDGSRDLTYAIATQHMQTCKQCTIRVIRKKNGGKASAMNYGLQFAVGEIVVIVDADSIIEKNTLRDIAKEFQRPDVVAVAGTVKVLNPVNILTHCTALECVSVPNLQRPAFSLLGIVMVVPGALGAFNRKRIMQCGLYDRDTITEDFDLTIKVAKGGGKIVAIPAISYTECPTTLKGFYKQRIRWYGGVFQGLLKHNNVMMNSRYGMLNRLGYPITLLMFIVPPFLDIVVIAFTILAIVGGLPMSYLIAFSLFFAFQFFLSGIAIMIDKNRPWNLIFYTPFSIFGYKQINNFIVIKSIFDVMVRGRNMKW
ncbi:MAG: glycosyltransferase [Thermoproteota archaeon]|nr:glycosyltransferase [Thermoproteota archaeon]